MSNIKSFVGASLLVLSLNIQAISAPSDETRPWCKLNGPHLSGRLGTLAPNLVHRVQKNRQPDAISRLLNVPFMRIEKDEFERLVGHSPTQNARKYYLIRASAFYLQADYSPNSVLRVLVNAKGDALEVDNYALANASTSPGNLALVVELDNVLKNILVRCEAAE